ncbi:low molecular weight phosphatase family protein [Micromonospora sp. URMC 103]|uniref:arsenate reductase/protein-tyrosine-phosphatase family protein n=1 Tax=Micromonospora sp. URMC 103 TaxID=3423406 RepID=UPI003F1D0E03
MTDRVLFVCHANLCRSPMAEYLARRLLAGRPVTVASAGTDAVEGLPMHPYAADIAAETGDDPTDFRSRPLRAEYLVGATLVLTATRRQRSVCTSLAPSVLHRTFTLRQFGRLAAAAEPPEEPAGDPLRAAVEAAARARGRLQPAAPGTDDLRDPIGGTAADFRRCAEEIERSIRPLAALIVAAG